MSNWTDLTYISDADTTFILHGIARSSKGE
jgi:hypothetical protein